MRAHPMAPKMASQLTDGAEPEILLKCTKSKKTDVVPRINDATTIRCAVRVFIIWLTSQMSHGRDWRDSWLCRRRDSPGRWLWRLVRPFHFSRSVWSNTATKSGACE